MNQQNDQSIEIKDLTVSNDEALVGGTKLPSPNLPISSPKPPRK